MFRFSIRELILLTVIVAISLGWWLDRSRLALENKVYARWLAATFADSRSTTEEEMEIREFLRWRESQKNP